MTSASEHRSKETEGLMNVSGVIDRIEVALEYKYNELIVRQSLQFVQLVDGAPWWSSGSVLDHR